jgi:hypothetical protein
MRDYINAILPELNPKQSHYVCDLMRMCPRCGEHVAIYGDGHHRYMVCVKYEAYETMPTCHRNTPGCGWASQIISMEVTP